MASTLSYESRKELAQLRASIRINPSSFRHPVVAAKDQWIPDISEPEDVGIEATPEVAVYGGKTRSVEPIVLHRCGIGFAELVTTYPTHPSFAGPRVRKIKGHSVTRMVEANTSATRTRERMHDAEFAYCLRDQDDNEILRRWNQPDDVLDELDAIEAADERELWVERMTAFREAQLRRLLRDYFGESYMTKEIVLRWEQKDGRWTPAEKMQVADWVAKKIEEKGSRLSGFASCAGTIRSKMTRRRISRDKTGQSGALRWSDVYNAV